MTETTPAAVIASAATSFVQSLGINTHIDFSWSAYDDLAAVQNALNYLGIKNVRDSIDNPADPAKFLALNQNLGIKFDFFIAPGSVGLDWQLQQIESLPTIVRFVEGPNETDNWPQTYAGLTGFAATIAEQQALYASVKSMLPGVQVIAPSFGHLYNFPLVGDLSAWADYGAAHIYFGSGNSPGDQNWIDTVIDLAELVTPGKPMMVTETGYYTSTDPYDIHGIDQTVHAKYILDDVMDLFSAGVAMDYLYELVDQQPDPGNTNAELHFGLFNNDWTPKPAAIAVHNLLQLLQDPGTPGFTPGSLSYSLSGMPETAHSLLLEKSDGTFVLSIWNDVRLSGPIAPTVISVAPVPVTLTLGDPAARIAVYDPLTGTNVIRSATSVSQITLSLPDHPILVEIGTNAGAAIPRTTTPPALLTAPTSPSGITVNAPASTAVTDGQAVSILGVSITDPWAAANLGGMTLFLTATNGTLALTDAGGHAVAGSGSSAIRLDGSLFQINTNLSHLSYTASGVGVGTITFDAWDPAGIEAVRTIDVTAAAAPPVSDPPPSDPVVVSPPPSDPVVVSPPPSDPVVISPPPSDPVVVSPPPSDPVVVSPPPTGPVIAVPTGETVVAGAKLTIEGLTITDAFAAANPGSLALTLTAANGTLSMLGADGNPLAGSGTNLISVSGTLSEINADLARLAYTAPASPGADSIGIDIWDQAGIEAAKTIAVTVVAAPPPQSDPLPADPLPADPGVVPPSPSGPVITVPTNESVVAGGKLLISGLTITDAFAASNPGSLALNLTAAHGTLSMTGADGKPLAGSGTASISVSGTLDEINADLARLSYIASATPGTDSIGVDIWDQAGQEGYATVAVTVQTTVAPLAAIAPPSLDASLFAAQGEGGFDLIISASNATVSAGIWDRAIFLAGTGDWLTATGGNQTVMAFAGGNTITTGAGNDTIRIGGSGNVVNAGAGANRIEDSGSQNTIVLPTAGNGFDDIYGYPFANGDVLDVRALLSAAGWAGNQATIGSFLHIASPNGVDAVISVTIGGQQAGASYDVATLHGAGPASFDQLLAHARY